MTPYEEICSLKARYFRFVDTKQWDDLRGLFLDNTVFDYPENPDGVLTVDVAMRFIIDSLDHAVSIHQGYMPEIEILSETQARGRWLLEDRIFWAPGNLHPMNLHSLHGFGYYEEDYVRVDGKWYFQKIKLVRRHLNTSVTPA